MNAMPSSRARSGRRMTRAPPLRRVIPPATQLSSCQAVKTPRRHRQEKPASSARGEKKKRYRIKQRKEGSRSRPTGAVWANTLETRRARGERQVDPFNAMGETSSLNRSIWCHTKVFITFQEVSSSLLLMSQHSVPSVFFGRAFSAKCITCPPLHFARRHFSARAERQLTRQRRGPRSSAMRRLEGRGVARKPPAETPPARGARRGIFGWALLLTSPVLLLALALSARARSWACRMTLSLCLPILHAAARRLGLAGDSAWDPNARTIEDPVRRTSRPSETTGKEAGMILGTPRAYRAFCKCKCPVALPDGVATLPRDHHPTLPRDPGLTRSSSANHSRPRHPAPGPARVARGRQLPGGGGEAIGERAVGVVAGRPSLSLGQRGWGIIATSSTCIGGVNEHRATDASERVRVPVNRPHVPVGCTSDRP